MEHGPNTTQRDADPAPGALADLRPDTPFGGAKQSGIGFEMGQDGLEECTQTTIINVAK